MEDLKIVRTVAEMDSLIEYLKDKEYISYDCETTGLDKDSEIIGFSVCAELDKAYYVVVAEWSGVEQKLKYLETKEYSPYFLSTLINKKLIMHNGVFDCWQAEKNYGVKLISSLHTDTMILAHLVNENRLVGLKELGVSIFGDDAKKEQKEMKESVTANGGVLTKNKYELYKADSELIGRYGAKDTLLTLKLFYELIPQLYEQELDKFFYEDESMPLLKGPTYDLNTSGLRIDSDALVKLKSTLEAECLEAKAFIYSEITPHVKDKYPGTTKTNVFNIGSSKQLSWLLFYKLGNQFDKLTKGGREVCKALDMKIPYSFAAKRDFIATLMASKGKVYEQEKWNPKTKKMSRPKKLGDAWNYIASDKETLTKLAPKYKWVSKLLEYSKNLKLLNTYVEGIQERAQYNIIRPSFLQHGTTSGRYSSRNPNFQNLPRKDKRVKSCIVARPGKVFVGADYSQLEPRVFASMSKDEKLIKSFKDKDDFYSVIGIELFEKTGCSLKKEGPDSFAEKYKDLRDVAKVVGLSSTYGTTAPKMAPLIGRSIDEAQDVIDKYFDKFPSVMLFMLQCHDEVKNTGKVVNLFGRPRRIPDAKNIKEIYGNRDHSELPYNIRNMLNLAVNHTVQSTGASIMNRAAIACWRRCRELEKTNKLWSEVKIVLQIHDELVLEGPESLASQISDILKDSMENTVILPEVDLIAEPKIGKSLSELK